MSKKGQKGLVDKTKAHELNMAVLRRIDPETEEVRGGGRRQKGLRERRRGRVGSMWAGVGEAAGRGGARRRLWGREEG